MNNKKKILIISIIALVITLIGSTYAFFMYSKTTRAFTLTSGDIEIQFVNGENNINLTYAYPISDNFAKANLEKLGYIDFSVNGNITEDKKVINYEIYLEEDTKNTLDANYIKVYLTNDNNKEIVSPKIYNSLDKTSYSNSDNGKVIYKVSKKGEFNDKYRIYVWIDSKYSQNEIQERFSFKVNLYAYNDNETAVSVIKSKLVKYADSSKEDFSGGLVAVNTDGELYNETNPNESIREYRYSGLNVDNYVTFNNETWRIIGVFKEDNEEFLKIVRTSNLSADFFPTEYKIGNTIYKIKLTNSAVSPNYITGNDKYDWANGGMQYYLNTKTDDNGVKGYLSFIKDEDYKKIRSTIYYLGTVGDPNTLNEHSTVIAYYNDERKSEMCPSTVTTNSVGNNCYVWSGNQATWKGEIALPYPSDYGYSANQKYWTNIQVGKGGYDLENVKQTNWMLKMFFAKATIGVNALYFLSPSQSSPTGISSIVSTGRISAGVTDNVNRDTMIIPTLYLKSNVKIISGDGSQDNAYQLSLN